MSKNIYDSEDSGSNSDVLVKTPRLVKRSKNIYDSEDSGSNSDVLVKTPRLVKRKHSCIDSDEDDFLDKALLEDESYVDVVNVTRRIIDEHEDSGDESSDANNALFYDDPRTDSGDESSETESVRQKTVGNKERNAIAEAFETAVINGALVKKNAEKKKIRKGESGPVDKGPLQIYDVNDQDDGGYVNDQDDGGDEEGEDHSSNPNLCTSYLSNPNQFNRVTKKMGKIVNSQHNFSQDAKVLFSILSEEGMINYGDALSCIDLYKIYLQKSGNLLLLRIMESPSQKGRNGESAKQFIAICVDLQLGNGKGTTVHESSLSPIYEDYKNLYNKVFEDGTCIKALKSSFKRHWKEKYRSLIKIIYKREEVEEVKKSRKSRAHTVVTNPPIVFPNTGAPTAAPLSVVQTAPIEIVTAANRNLDDIVVDGNLQPSTTEMQALEEKLSLREAEIEKLNFIIKNNTTVVPITATTGAPVEEITFPAVILAVDDVRDHTRNLDDNAVDGNLQPSTTEMQALQRCLKEKNSEIAKLRQRMLKFVAENKDLKKQLEELNNKKLSHSSNEK